MQLVEVLLRHSTSPGRQGNGVTIGKRRGRSESVVPQVKPLLSPPLHRSGHWDFKVGIYPVPRLNMDNHAPRDRQLSFRILRAPDVKEVLSLIKLTVDPQVSLTQSHKGHNTQE
jgi:hypothetical protein